MSLASKLKKGFKIKESPVRTKDEIDKDYTHHAVQAGHKMRVINQLQQEVEHHLAKLEQVNAEAMNLPPQPAPVPPPAQEGST